LAGEQPERKRMSLFAPFPFASSLPESGKYWTTAYLFNLYKAFCFWLSAKPQYRVVIAPVIKGRPLLGDYARTY
jgi:hypothetical protein